MRVQAVPSQWADIEYDDRLPSRRYPTAQASSPFLATTPTNAAGWWPAPGDVTSDHALPSQCSMSVRVPWRRSSVLPTAQMSSADTALTASRREFGCGVGTWTCVMRLPSQCRTSALG